MANLSPRLCTGIVLLCVGLVLVALVAIYDGDLLPNDTAQYLSVARHLSEGEGVKTDLVFFKEHHIQKTMPVKETGFAPGFPFLVSRVAAVGVSLSDAAFLVVSVAFALTAVLLYALVSGATESPQIAAGSALVWLSVVSCWFNAWERLSELPFIACTLLATQWLPRSDKASPAVYVFSGAATAAAIGIRYAGSFFFVSVLIVLLADLWRHRSRRACLAVLGYAGLPVGTVVGLMWRNYRTVGVLLGGNERFEAATVTEVLGRYAKAVLHLTGLSRAGFAEPRGAEIALMLAVPLTLSLLIWQRRSIHFDEARMSAAKRDRRVQIALVYVVTSIPLLFLADLGTAMTIQARMLLVGVPYVLLLVACLVNAVQLDTRRARVAVAVSLVALGLAYGLGQLQVVEWQRSRPNLHAEVQDALELEVGPSTAAEFLRSRASIEHPLLGNEPQVLGAILQSPVVGLPPAPYSDIVWSFDEVWSVVESYDIQVVVFMPGAWEASSERVLFFDRLGNGDRPSWLKPITGDGDLRLFRVDAGNR